GSARRPELDALALPGRAAIAPDSLRHLRRFVAQRPGRRRARLPPRRCALRRQPWSLHSGSGRRVAAPGEWPADCRWRTSAGHRGLAGRPSTRRVSDDFEYVCHQCGELHAGLPYAYGGAHAPDYWNDELASDETSLLDEELCVIGGENFFVRARIIVP